MNKTLLSISAAVLLTATTQGATFNVTSLSDAGAGSLRAALEAAEQSAEADVILFSVGGTVTLLAPLPAINTPVTIDGNGLLVTVDGNQSAAVGSLFRVSAGGNLTLSGLNLINGRALNGGALDNAGQATVVNCAFRGHAPNGTSGGGAIFNAGSMTISRSSFESNIGRQTGGGAIRNNGTLNIQAGFFDSNSAFSSFGGGIYNAGSLRVEGSTFVRNASEGGGGAIHNVASLILTSSTVTGNRTDGGSGGGVENTGSLRITNATFSRNINPSAVSSGAADLFTSNALAKSVLIEYSTFVRQSTLNSVVAQQAAITVSNSILAHCSGVLDPASSGNLIQAGNCVPFSQLFLGDLKLADQLAINRGTPETHALLAGSPAIDAATGPCPATDARGQQRAVDGDLNGTARCDIGSFEYRPPVRFSGFQSPLNNSFVSVNAGRSVPIRFSLGGFLGDQIFSQDYPASTQVACPGTVTVTSVATESSVVSNSTLQFESANGQYLFLWRTDSSWAGTCREFSVAFLPGDGEGGGPILFLAAGEPPSQKVIFQFK